MSSSLYSGMAHAVASASAASGRGVRRPRGDPLVTHGAQKRALSSKSPPAPQASIVKTMSINSHEYESRMKNFAFNNAKCRREGHFAYPMGLASDFTVRQFDIGMMLSRNNRRYGPEVANYVFFTTNGMPANEEIQFAGIAAIDVVNDANTRTENVHEVTMQRGGTNQCLAGREYIRPMDWVFMADPDVTVTSPGADPVPGIAQVGTNTRFVPHMAPMTNGAEGIVGIFRKFENMLHGRTNPEPDTFEWKQQKVVDYFKNGHGEIAGASKEELAAAVGIDSNRLDTEQQRLGDNRVGFQKSFALNVVRIVEDQFNWHMMRLGGRAMTGGSSCYFEILLKPT